MGTHSLVVSYALLAPAHVAVPFGNGSAAAFPTLNVGTPVLGSESGGLVEVCLVAGRVREHPIEHDDVGSGSAC